MTLIKGLDGVMRESHATPLSDAVHAAFCKRGHQMDQCGYGWATYDDFYETRQWVAKSEAWFARVKDIVPDLTLEQAIALIGVIPS